MPNRRRPTRRGRHVDLHQAVAEAADVALMEAVVSGCALIAYADGSVQAEEEQRMRRLIRTFAPLRAFDQDEMIAYFDEVTESFRSGIAHSEARAISKVARLAGRGTYPTLLVDVCVAIAEADGRYEESEKAVIGRLCQELSLDPAEFEPLAA